MTQILAHQSFALLARGLGEGRGGGWGSPVGWGRRQIYNLFYGIGIEPPPPKKSHVGVGLRTGVLRHVCVTLVLTRVLFLSMRPVQNVEPLSVGIAKIHFFLQSVSL